MKKFFVCLIGLIVVFVAGCDTQGLMCAHISDATQGLSTNYAVKVVLDDDSRVEDKYVDLQIKSSVENLKILLGKEGDEKHELAFETADEWYNLTILQANANGMSGKETYEKYSEKGNLTYLFTTEENATLTFRVVVGSSVENDDKTGFILTSTECVSNELEIKAKASEQQL